MDEEVPEGDYRSYLDHFTNLLEIDYPAGARTRRQ